MVSRILEKAVVVCSCSFVLACSTEFLTGDAATEDESSVDTRSEDVATDDASEEEVVEITLEDACETVIGFVCDYRETCCLDEGERLLLDDLLTAYNFNCEDIRNAGRYWECLAFGESIDEGRVRLNPGVFATCQTAMRSFIELCYDAKVFLRHFDGWTAAVCDGILEGLQGEGDDCTIDFDCPPGFYCDADASCSEKLGEGRECTEGRECGSGLVCMDETLSGNPAYCIQPRQEGESCERTEHCAVPLTCMGEGTGRLCFRLLGDGSTCGSSEECEGFCDALECQPLCSGP